MDAVVIGDSQTNVSLFAGDNVWPVEARFISPVLSASFRGGELNCDLGKTLTAIYDGATQHSEFGTEDGFFGMELKRDSLGHIEVTAEGRRYGSPETHARLLFRIDQSYLPPAIAAARRIFPFGPCK